MSLIFTLCQIAKTNDTLADRQNKLRQLHTELIKTNRQKADTEAQVKAKAVHEADLQRQIEELKKLYEAKKAAQLAQAQAIQAPPVRTVAAFYPISGGRCSFPTNDYANYIYYRESTCNPGAVNPGGCAGIGQACPASKLYAVCPDMNLACQMSFFDGYANRYGGWAGSYAFWIAHSWW